MNDFKLAINTINKIIYKLSNDDILILKKMFNDINSSKNDSNNFNRNLLISRFINFSKYLFNKYN